MGKDLKKCVLSFELNRVGVGVMDRKNHFSAILGHGSNMTPIISKAPI